MTTLPGGIAAALALALAALPAAAPTAAQDVVTEAEALASRARDAAAAGAGEEAVRLARQALAADPEWNEGRWLLGTALYGLERFDEARDAFRDVVAREPESGSAWALKGLAELRLARYDKALEDLERARALGVFNREIEAVAVFQLAQLLTRFEQYEPALALLTGVVGRGSEGADVVEAMGLALLRIPVLPAELEPDQRERVLMAGRAAVLWAKNRREAARSAFEELLLRYPEQGDVHFAYGLFLQFEDPDAALREFRRELELQPLHVEARLALAWELLQRREHEEALPLAREAVDLAPTEAAARRVLGRLLLEAGDVPAAILNLEEGVRLAPGSPELRFALAQGYARAGRDEDAARERAVFQELSRESATDGAGIGGIDFSGSRGEDGPQG